MSLVVVKNPLEINFIKVEKFRKWAAEITECPFSGMLGVSPAEPLGDYRTL